MQKIFIVEDDRHIREELTTLLERTGYEAITSTDFEHMLQSILLAAPDLVILDLNLPFVDGHVLCRELRKKTNISIIVVTSRDNNRDELVSINLGADDFITKPYNADILLARISSVLRRAQGVSAEQILSDKGLELDVALGQVSFQDRSAVLTKNEMRILRLLMQRSGQIVSRADIQNEIWQSDEFIDDNTLTVNIARLRNTLASIGVKDLLQTKRGQGYLI
jgi:DNA-binding response OmpR family regulator